MTYIVFGGTLNLAQLKFFVDFQTDLYGLIGTVHVLLFGEYMNVTYRNLLNSRWETTMHFNRFVSFYAYCVDLLY